MVDVIARRPAAGRAGRRARAAPGGAVVSPPAPSTSRSSIRASAATRRALCVETDAGALRRPGQRRALAGSALIERAAVVELTEERFFLTPRSHTFHGRDVFAPVAAALATGDDPSALGPERRRPRASRIAGAVPARRRGHAARSIYVDRFGNLTTNVAPDGASRRRRMRTNRRSAHRGGRARATPRSRRAP